MSRKPYQIFQNEHSKRIRSPSYNYNFDKRSGLFLRWGKNPKDDPDYSPFGPEIADIELTTICGNGCKFCSPKGSKVNTPHGSKNIEKVKRGDYVIGFNIENNRIKMQKVEETYKRHYSGDIICIELENGEILKLTPDHIVILKGGKEKQAKNLNKEDEIISF